MVLGKITYKKNNALSKKTAPNDNIISDINGKEPEKPEIFINKKD